MDLCSDCSDSMYITVTAQIHSSLATLQLLELQAGIVSSRIKNKIRHLLKSNTIKEIEQT